MKLEKPLLSIALVLAFALTGLAQGKKPAPAESPKTESNGEAPKLVIDSFTHDFGEVKAGTPLNYSFVVKNQGNANLEIKNVAPG
jgi:hypothetical protein